MSEYEIAGLGLREAALWTSAAHAAAALVIGAGQIAIVWYGIHALQRMGAQRAREQDQRHEEAMQRFDDQRRALETLIERTAPASP